jgi:hypothetical protein
MPGNPQFWNVLKGKRILVVNSNPDYIKAMLQRDPYNLKVTATIPFSHYNQMKQALTEIKKIKNRFDIALISCGVNAVILAQRTAALTGKVAIDFGKAPMVIERQGGADNKKSSGNRNPSNNTPQQGSQSDGSHSSPKQGYGSHGSESSSQGSYGSRGSRSSRRGNRSRGAHKSSQRGNRSHGAHSSSQRGNRSHGAHSSSQRGNRSRGSRSSRRGYG